jgi:hypothetical protein
MGKTFSAPIYDFCGSKRLAFHRENLAHLLPLTKGAVGSGQRNEKRDLFANGRNYRTIQNMGRNLLVESLLMMNFLAGILCGYLVRSVERVQGWICDYHVYFIVLKMNFCPGYR